MNSATRLIALVKAIEKNKGYFNAIENIFKISDAFERYTLYKYFIIDVKNIEKILKNKGKYKEIHKAILVRTLAYISPSSPLSNNGSVLINELELIESSLDDETLYSADIEALRLKIKGIEPTGTFLDEIINDIDEALTYYGFFGEIIVDDKYNQAVGKFFINKHKLVTFVQDNKVIKAVNLILSFFDTYSKIKEAPQKLLTIIDDVRKLFEENSEDEILDVQIEE